MKNISKIFKIKIKNVIISIDIDSSYLPENLYNAELYNSLKVNHHHAWQEVFFTENDPILLYYKGKKLEFSECILFIPPFVEHCTLRKSGYRITFSYKKLGKKKNGCFLDDFFMSEEPFKIPCTANIIRYAREIEKNFFTPAAYSDEMIECFLKLIFCEIALMRNCENGKKYITDESYLDKIENILLDFREDMNLGTIAKKLNLSTRQVSRILRENYHSTFSNMLCERRLNVAASLLANTDMTIAQIVEYVNFPSESYFYARFKKEYGITPAGYRKTKSVKL